MGAMVLASSVIIVLSRLEIRLLSSARYYSAWQYIPTLTLAMLFSAFASFMGSVYVVMEKSQLSLRTSIWGAGANIVLNLILIPRMGANGAAVATACAFVVVFLTRSRDTRRFIKINYQPVVLTCQTVVLVAQTVAALCLQGVWFYVAEALLFALMLGMNWYQVVELYKLVTTKMLSKLKKPKTEEE